MQLRISCAAAYVYMVMSSCTVWHAICNKLLKSPRVNCGRLSSWTSSSAAQRTQASCTAAASPAARSLHAIAARVLHGTRGKQRHLILQMLSAFIDS